MAHARPSWGGGMLRGLRELGVQARCAACAWFSSRGGGEGAPQALPAWPCHHVPRLLPVGVMGGLCLGPHVGARAQLARGCCHVCVRPGCCCVEMEGTPGRAAAAAARPVMGMP